MTITLEQEEELNTITDRNIFGFWKEEILTIYQTGRKSPNGRLKRALHRSTLIYGEKNRYTWSESGLALIEAELSRRKIMVERHRSLHWR